MGRRLLGSVGDCLGQSGGTDLDTRTGPYEVV